MYYRNNNHLNDDFSRAENCNIDIAKLAISLDQTRGIKKNFVSFDKKPRDKISLRSGENKC